MKRIPLTQDKVALVDDCDYEWLNRWKWFVVINKKRKTLNSVWYAARQIRKPNGKQNHFYMHNAIMRPPLGIGVDHINGDGLNNRKINLRFALKKENNRNGRMPCNNKSGYKGVYYVKGMKRKKRWQAQLRIGKTLLSLGLYFSRIPAARAYDTAARKHFGEFARLNFSGPGEQGCRN